MAKTPYSSSVELITFTILAEGKQISDLFQVHTIETTREINKIPIARISIYDGSPAEEDFEISDEKVFLPGQSIEIKAGYESIEKTIFKGTIVKQGVKIPSSGGSLLVIEVVDAALKMTLQRKNDLFPQIKDSDLITKLISSNGLGKDVEATKVKYDEIVQYHATDWDLMLMRAEVNGMLVTVVDGKVTVKKPDTSQAPVLEVKYGDTMLSFQAEMDASTQLKASAIKSYSWSAATQALIESGPGSINIKEQGNVTSATLAGVFSIPKFSLQSSGSITKESLQDWSSAELQKSQLSKIRGVVRFQGNADVLPGKMIALAGVGDRFNGNALISSVNHRIENGDWITEVHFGMSFKWFSQIARNIADPDAAGQLPPAKGLFTGIVKKVDGDPNGEFRILVNLPLLQNNSKSLWARLGTFYTGSKIGSFFMPEIGDEVIVGFFNEDPRYPVVLGSMYSKKIAAPFTPDEKNTKKALISREKLSLTFDDKDKIIEIKTPGGHSFKMDDKTGEIVIKDSNKNIFSLSKSGVSIESASNMKINAKGNINIGAKGNIALAATANVTVEGTQISNTAKAKFSAKGNAAAELTASGIVTVKGAMVKIN